MPYLLPSQTSVSSYFLSTLKYLNYRYLSLLNLPAPYSFKQTTEAMPQTFKVVIEVSGYPQVIGWKSTGTSFVFLFAVLCPDVPD